MLRDPRSQYYFFHRDALGRLGSEVDPRGKYTYHGYDRAGNATSLINRRNQTVTATYDELNRLATRTAEGATTTWTADPAGLWAEASNAAGTVRTEIQPAARAVRTVTTLGGVP
jgi:YD repeat-containing protein